MIRNCRFKIYAAVLLLAASALGGDINKGYTFLDGEKNVTHTKLNNLVDGASINTTFFTDKSAQTNAASADVILLYSPTLNGFRKITWNSLLLGNPALLTSQSEKTAAVTNDLVLIYSSADGQWRKVALLNLLGNATQFATIPTTLDLLHAAEFEAKQGGTNNRVPLTQLLQLFNRTTWTNQFTNLFDHVSLVEADRLLLFSSVNGSNRTMTVSNLIAGLPTTGAPSNAATIMVLDVAASGARQLRQVPFSSLNAAGLAFSNQLPIKFVSAEFAVPSGNNQVITTNTPHGLPGTPQEVRWVLVCKTPEFGYAAGDELNVASCFDGTANPIPSYGGGANSTNVFLLQGRPPQTWSRSTATAVTLTLANWRAKCYAIYFP